MQGRRYQEWPRPTISFHSRSVCPPPHTHTTLIFCHRLALHLIPSRKGLFDHCTTNGWKKRSSLVCTSAAVARTPLTPRSHFPSVFTLSLKKSRGLERLVCWTRSFLPTCRWMRSRPSLHHAIPRHLLRHAGPRPAFSRTFHSSQAVSFGSQKCLKTDASFST